MLIQLLFVYGTLLTAFDNPPARSLRTQAECLGRASFGGRLYLVDGYPGAIRSDKSKERVWGELWRMTGDPTALLNELDAYEECTPDFPEPHEYRRCHIRVTHEDGREFHAWTWLYDRPVAGLKRIPSGDFLVRCTRHKTNFR